MGNKQSAPEAKSSPTIAVATARQQQREAESAAKKAATASMKQVREAESAAKKAATAAASASMKEARQAQSEARRAATAAATAATKAANESRKELQAQELAARRKFRESKHEELIQGMNLFCKKLSTNIESLESILKSTNKEKKELANIYLPMQIKQRDTYCNSAYISSLFSQWVILNINEGENDPGFNYPSELYLPEELSTQGGGRKKTRKNSKAKRKVTKRRS